MMRSLSLALLWLAACAGGAEGPAPSPSCTGDSLTAGRHPILMQFEGRTRRFDLYVPESHDGVTPLPMVVHMHGFLDESRTFAATTRMPEAAGARGYITLMPDGFERSWNGGSCCGTGVSEDIDDVAFLRAAVAEAGAQACVDLSRVYASGFSNGGYMAHRLACEAPDLVAGVFSVAGMSGTEACAPTRGVPVLHLHGDEDSVIPYDGGGLFEAPSAAESFARMASAMQCTDAREDETVDAQTTCTRAPRCRDGATVTQCTLVGVNHCWPGIPCAGFGGAPWPNAESLVANDVALDFFDSLDAD